ncbi:IS66 family insertion sequence element accessory protein TnpA [Vibrio agarivorans]|uniref:Helix-turn-helix domain-containing protein n=1 Tax=Vibrio agarivorans TaxID=153622 RepID=A0ABT7Y5R7_9VIBR|nr:helix-turn-helix domain-containing protein [Vibrio agarivorans]MDN2483398.1 helix-turn-helix domain-containing protein [Vibrio agarivorans]
MDHQSKRKHWSAILEQQRQSNLGIKQFCTEQNISYQTFYYWSKKLSQPEPETRVQPIVVSEPTASPSCVVLTLSNGIKAELPTTLSPQQIKSWVEALQ